MSRYMLAFIGLMAWSLGGLADTSRVDHYEGEAAQSLEEALVHLAEYNARLAATIEGESLMPSDLNDVHQLTYTLENALERIRLEVAVIAETLEEVHVASEQAQAQRVQERTKAYLEASKPLAEGP